MSESTAAATGVADEKHTREIRIIVNGEPKIVESEIVSYEQVVRLAYPAPPSPDTLFTVTFRNAQEPREGSLAPGGTVEVRQGGTIFNVKATGKS
jgi:hypothetical protein